MTESDKHINFKQLIATILSELNEEGMKIKGIQQEKERDVDKHIEKIKSFRTLKIINEDIGSMACQSKIPYVFYLVWSDDENIDCDDIFLNLSGDIYSNYREHKKYMKQYDVSQRDFVVIEVKSKYSFFNHHKDDPVKLSFNGSLFLLGITTNIKRKYENLLFQYRFTEDQTCYKTIKYDVGCNFRNKQFGFEIGHSNYEKRKEVLVLDYKYLESTTYTDIKKRIRNFLKKSLEN